MSQQRVAEQFKQHILISHNWGGWKGQDQGAGGFGTVVPFALQMATFLSCPHMTGREEGGPG